MGERSAVIRHTLLKAFNAGAYDASLGLEDRSEDYGPRSVKHYRAGRAVVLDTRQDIANSVEG